MKEVKKAVVIVIGKDMVGILSKVSTAIAGGNASVIEVSQTVLDGYFCMIMIVDITEAVVGFEELKNSIADSVPEMKVHLMHEDIFNSMHRI